MADIHLDYSVLSALQEVMEGEYPLLLDTFLSDSERRLSQLHHASNPIDLGQTAHSFKGSSSNMGARRLAYLCELLEERVKEVSPSGIEELVSRIEGEYATVRRLYRAERQRFIH